jgi:alpha-L-fucosidase
MDSSYHPDMTWWRNARFGMFIHWGLYSIPGGQWKNDPLNIGSAEWIMHHLRIPVREYEKLAAEFNPVEFDPDGIAGLARDAGMKYLVITAKHHEGFAMFKSNASAYNVVDGSPFGRDIIGELAEACAKKDVRFGVYYSQALDWHHPDAAGNDWDFDEDKKDFQHFLDDKVFPQVDELLSNYGPIAQLWFDTPTKITVEQSKKLLAFVREKQPDCIVNSRLGPGGDKEWGDYISLRDNEVPTMPLMQNGETCATINKHWGYNQYDLDFRPAHDIAKLLADVVAKNANYLLNIGPDGLGRVPEGSVKVLRDIGRWLETNGESIYETSPTPFATDLDWGAVTRRPGRLYFHMFDSPGERLTIRGLNNVAAEACFLDTPDAVLPVSQEPVPGASGLLDTTIEIGASGPTEIHRVLALDIDGEADVHPETIEQPDGLVTLESLVARNMETGKPMADEIMVRGAVAASLQDGHVLEWSFETLEPGTFDVCVECALGRYSDGGGNRVADTGHEIAIEVNGGRIIEATVEEHERFGVRGNDHWPAIRCTVGTVEIKEPGTHSLRLSVRHVNIGKGGGFILRQVRLMAKAKSALR